MKRGGGRGSGSNSSFSGSSRVSSIPSHYGSKRGPRKYTHGRKWYCPLPDPRTIIIATGIVVAFVLVSWWYWYIAPKMGSCLHQWEGYAKLATTYFVLVAFYLVADGFSREETITRTNAVDSSQDQLELLFIELSPEIIPLQKEMYRDDEQLQELKEPTVVDVPKQQFFMYWLGSRAIHDIDNGMSVVTVQNRGIVNTWRSQLRSKYIRQLWSTQQHFYDDLTRRAVDQDFLPDAPRPRVPPCASWQDTPLLVVMALAVIITIIFTIVWFYWYAPHALHDSFRARVQLYLELMEALYLAFFTMLVAGDINRNDTAADFAFDEHNMDNIETAALSNWPYSLPWAKDIYKHEPMLQRIELPPFASEAERELFEVRARQFAISMNRVLGQTIESSLNLAPPTEGEKFRWREWYLSHPLLRAWKWDKRFLTKATDHFISHKIIAKPNRHHD